MSAGPGLPLLGRERDASAAWAELCRLRASGASAAEVTAARARFEQLVAQGELEQLAARGDLEAAALLRGRA